jgi:hypothetical protein
MTYTVEAPENLSTCVIEDIDCIEELLFRKVAVIDFAAGRYDQDQWRSEGLIIV